MQTNQFHAHRAEQAREEATTRFLSVPGGRIAYDDAGSGPVVICAPSLGDVRAEYRFLRPQLETAGFRVVTMDLRGHGESSTGFTDYSAPAIGGDILALARHLDAGPAAVIGTSKAGSAAPWAAIQAPDAVNRLVLINAFVRSRSGDWLLKTLLNVLLSRPWGPAFWSGYFPKFYPTRQPDDFGVYRARLKANLREPGRIEAVRAMISSADPGVEERLTRVTAPTLVVMGTKDPDFKDPAAEGQWIAEQVHGTVCMVEGAGHYPQAELPEHVGPSIVHFLAQGKSSPAL